MGEVRPVILSDEAVQNVWLRDMSAVQCWAVIVRKTLLAPNVFVISVARGTLCSSWFNERAGFMESIFIGVLVHTLMSCFTHWCR